jgi:hypothetical protein
MPTRRVIDVPADVIAGAIPEDSGHCMIADAIRIAYPQAKAVSVDLQTIRWSDRKAAERYTFLTPPVAQRALIAFDQGENVEPFRFSVGTALHIAPIRAATKAEAERTGRSANYGKSTLKPGPASGKQVGPTVIGGMPPPRAVLSHKRGAPRRFGIRAAGRS